MQRVLRAKSEVIQVTGSHARRIVVIILSSLPLEYKAGRRRNWLLHSADVSACKSWGALPQKKPMADCWAPVRPGSIVEAANCAGDNAAVVSPGEGDPGAGFAAGSAASSFAGMPGRGRCEKQDHAYTLLNISPPVSGPKKRARVWPMVVSTESHEVGGSMRRQLRQASTSATRSGTRKENRRAYRSRTHCSCTSRNNRHPQSDTFRKTAGLPCYIDCECPERGNTGAPNAFVARPPTPVALDSTKFSL